MPRRFVLITSLLLAAGIPAGIVYADLNHIPAAVTGTALAAVLLELAFYFSIAFEPLRARWTPSALALSAPLPLLIYSIPAGILLWWQPLALLAMTIMAAWWYRILPRSRPADFAFVTLMAAPLLFKVFAQIYPSPDPELRLDFLGQLLWIRVGVCSVLNLRRQTGIGFGFIPSPGEWRIGAVAWAASMPAIFALVWLTAFARFSPPDQPPGRLLLAAVGTFFGVLWVVALSEEFFFRGLLQQWLDESLGSPTAGLLIASALFGAAHLGFRDFPNWRFAIVAACAGVAYGIAFRRGGGIRAAMVAHALLVTTWRLYFR